MKFCHTAYLILFGFLCPSLCYSQLSLTLPSLETCPGNFIIPVQAHDFNDIASVSMKLSFDTTAVAYDTFTDLNAAFTSGLFLLNATHQQVIFSWFSLNPVSIGNANLMNLHFHHLLNMNSLIKWDDDSLGNCVLTDINGVEIPTTLVDALITTSFHQPALLIPENKATGVGVVALFHWNGSACGPHYNLVYSKDSSFVNPILATNIFGTNYTSDSLEYSTTYWWKVQAVISSTPYYTDYSETYKFTTKSPDAIWQDSDILYNVSIFPNPAADECCLKFDLTKSNQIEVQIVNINSEIVQDLKMGQLTPGTYRRTFDIDNLKPGIYVIKIICTDAVQTSHTSAKLIILR